MPGLVRKLLIYASVNGLVVQAHGPVEHHKAIHVEYKTRQLKEWSDDLNLGNKGSPQLEAHGLLGLFSIASSSFLVAITRREQVAQIFGKQIYVVTDVAFLPLTTHGEATRAIEAAAASRRSNESSTDSELSDPETEEVSPRANTTDSESVNDEDQQPPLPRSGSSTSSTSIAQDVYAKKGQFGRFASAWFSKQGWGVQRGTSSTNPTVRPAKKAQGTAHGDAPAAALGIDHPNVSPESVNNIAEASSSGLGSVNTMIPKILRASRLILTSRSFFFSYDFDLTRRLSLFKSHPETPDRARMDPLYFWNRNLAAPLHDAGYDTFVMPVVQGFVGQRSFVVQKPRPNEPASTCVLSAQETEESDGVVHTVPHAKEGLVELEGSTQAFLLTLISRRSIKRAGLRYLRRGIDDEGNCANSVETEQILSSPQWDPARPIRSFIQIRASIPLYFSQSPYSFKPLPILHQSESANRNALNRHFEGLMRRYGNVQVALLVDKHGSEVSIGEAYEKTVKELTDSKDLQNVDFEWFDFHAECRGMKFENVDRLVQKLKDNIVKFGETVIAHGSVQTEQMGIIRTNCMDCLDRTNVAESAFAQEMLQSALAKDGFEIDLVHDQTTTWFNTLWADNGDAISRQYAGTAALKGDFTRTRKRDYRGALNDFSLTLTRFYNNMVNDYFSQAVIDVLLGNLSWKAFEDFESTMMSADPGISIEKVRENAIEACRKLVITDEAEDLIHGWTMLAPAHDNTLRTLPFQEAVVLLTDAAVYCCKFDWTTEKVASFEKVDLKLILKIQYGTYVTSTFTERQIDEEMNAGLVIQYRPGKGSIVRTNTRSLQNYRAPVSGQEDRIDGGTGVLSRLAPRSAPTSRAMAVKVIPPASDRSELEKRPSSLPLAIAESIAEQIQRATTGPPQEGHDKPNLMEKGDIISLTEAKKRTGYLEQLGYSIKKMVWS